MSRLGHRVNVETCTNQSGKPVNLKEKKRNDRGEINKERDN